VSGRKKTGRGCCAECGAECPEREAYPYASHKRSCRMASEWRAKSKPQSDLAERIYERLFANAGAVIDTKKHRPAILAAIREELSR
jgi:hypothetical protein